MKAKKANKVYTVNEVTKEMYLRDGYDIYDDNGKLLKKSPVSTVPYAKYAELEAQGETLKSENEKLKAKADALEAKLAELEKAAAIAETEDLNQEKKSSKKAGE